jgi:rare lipoprotein A (peptidoglycan hydrolase)
MNPNACGMNRTLANKRLSCIAIALTCGVLPILTAAGAAASTGGASAPMGKQAARSAAARSDPAHGTQIATWFGPGFYGQKTACGQTMTPKIVGVASRTLPCGTLVSIAYKDRRLTVPVIDRGPYAHNGATWDLTWAAASALSIEDTVRIRTKVVGIAPNTQLLGVPAEAQPPAIAVASGGTAAG